MQQLRQRIITSGMTAEQVRARLKAEGYPENLLDAYLPGSSGAAGAVGEDVLGAIRRLGIADDAEISTMRTMLGGAVPAAEEVRDEQKGQNQEDSDELFGLALFRSATSEFLPTMDGPVDANYRLGPGDQLVLILTDQVELAHTLDVTREGFVVIPQVGQLSVANLTLEQLENLLYQRLPRSYSGVRRGADAPTRFTVSVSRLRAIQVYVTGDVVRPSSYRISSAGTAMTALYAAGGPTERGSLREVTVRRAGRTVATLDVYDYLLRGDNSADVRLENGDVLFVRTHGPRVRVAGEVVRPATYELKPGETLRDALTAAGGFRATAATRRVQIQRIVPPAERVEGGRDRSVIDVASTGSTVADFPALSMTGGDVVRVFAVADRVRNRIVVNGNVWNPGPQAFRSGLTLSQALRAAGGLKSDTHLGRVQVTRLRPDSTRQQLHAMLRDTTGAVVEDLALAEDDEIEVFSVTEFRPNRFVAIGGSVRRSGRYPWREGMTLRDLVLLAGGLREGAYLREAEVARLPLDRSRGVTATTVRVPLDSSYLGDYVPGRPYAGAPGLASPAFGTSPEVVLSPYDNVLIMEQPDWQLQRTVTLTGEVRFPGRYALKSKDERISDLIARAGGLTKEAEADAAYFSRTQSNTSFAAQTVNERVRTRVGVDLSRALRRAESDDDLVLTDDDSLHVPFRRTTVEIIGLVNAPTAIAVDRGRTLRYYVRAAGGASATGDEKKVYVIQPNGKIEARERVLWVFVNNPTPRAGATVVVPAKEERASSSERVATVALIAQTIASIAAVAALLR
ncbi:MAG: SLBB domain-containing protein [Gemmatimonadota bacterium]|nr:SLBB domain-containing protein [Gemmatimonadota bacterium]